MIDITVVSLKKKQENLHWVVNEKLKWRIGYEKCNSLHHHNLTLVRYGKGLPEKQECYFF